MTRLCRDCRHYRAGHNGPSGTPGKQAMCVRERVGPAEALTCEAARRAGGDCGPAAMLFGEQDEAGPMSARGPGAAEHEPVICKLSP